MRFRRKKGPASEQLPEAEPKNFHFRPLLSIIQLGILGPERFHYWGLLIWTFFRRPALMELAVTVDGDRVELGEATPLFSMEENRLRGFDLSPDGKRFLMLQDLPEPEAGTDAEGIVVVQNWFEEFRSTTK